MEGLGGLVRTDSYGLVLVEGEMAQGEGEDLVHRFGREGSEEKARIIKGLHRFFYGI